MSLPAALLAQTIDDHIAWMIAWTRVACYEQQAPDAAGAEPLAEPESFAAWRNEASKTLQDQPMLTRLVGQYDQLHRLARLVILKTPEDTSVAAKDYDAVAEKYQELITGLRRLERALATAESGLDTLTGLRSRAGMRDDLTRDLSRFQRTAKPFCLAMLDIDFFKKVNDTYGHENGDRVLSAIANFVGRNVRPFDDAWRWGGEEILLCLKETDVETGKLALERLRSGLEKMPIKLQDGTEITVTASFGLAAVNMDSTIDNLLLRVDKALYSAKANGRNRVEIAGE
jgi:diguanylate cyclase (GGDEF)-like protein